jgi:methylmalonyl-CoA/ethylmalonyl-CoA epimerase
VIAGLSHVSIAVPDLEEAITVLQRRYGLSAGAIRTNREQGVRLAYVDLGNAKIELMEPTHAESPVAKFIQRNPRGGIHHFSLAADNFQSTIESLAAKGVGLVGVQGQRNVDNLPIAFIHPKDFLGALVELEGR